jgi:uncharacterized protein YkwD
MEERRMRTCLLFAAILSAPVVLVGESLAEEMPKSEVNQASATSEAAAGQTSQTAQRTRLFHRQPIFLGMLRRNNDIRRRAGLFPHRINPALTAAAQDHANYMARTGQFSHYTNGGPQYRANKFGFRGGVLENIAYGTTSVDGAFNMWQGSGAHYASIVSGTTEAGFGYAVGSGGQVYWVGVYASPAQGDPVGESDAVVAAALAEEEAARKEAEKNVAQDQPQDSNVVPASAETPVEAAAPAPAAANATTASQNPAGNVNTTNAQPQNYYYYPQNNNNNRRRWRRG